MNRRQLLAGAGTLTTGVLAGCSGLGGEDSTPETTDSEGTPAHWVTVYLGEREETHDVSVTVTDESGDVVFEESYALSDQNEAVEHDPFPATAAPETVVVTVDGVRFERDWPGFEVPELPCDDPNRAGVELTVEDGADGDPELQLLADCQHVTTEDE